MKIFKQARLAGMICALLGAPLALANADQNMIQRYEQAQITMDFQGSLGELLQQMAQNLNIGYLSYELNAAQAVNVKFPEPITIKFLADSLSAQLQDTNVRFEEIGGRIFLVATGKNSAPLALQQAKPEEEKAQFIGQPVFSDEAKADAKPQEAVNTESKAAEKPEAAKEEKPAVKVEDAPKAEEVKAVEPKAEEKPAEPAKEEPKQPENAAEVKPEAAQQAAPAEQAAQPAEAQPQGDAPVLVVKDTPTEDDMNAKLLSDIVSQATDEQNLKKYKKKKSPQYRVSTIENLGLENVRVTPLGTFLVFPEGVDTSVFAVKGEFESIAQHKNLIAILHEKRNAPDQIDVLDPDGRRLLIKRVSK